MGEIEETEKLYAKNFRSFGFFAQTGEFRPTSTHLILATDAKRKIRQIRTFLDVVCPHDRNILGFILGLFAIRKIPPVCPYNPVCKGILAVSL